MTIATRKWLEISRLDSLYNFWSMSFSDRLRLYFSSINLIIFITKSEVEYKSLKLGVWLCVSWKWRCQEQEAAEIWFLPLMARGLSFQLLTLQLLCLSFCVLRLVSRVLSSAVVKVVLHFRFIITHFFILVYILVVLVMCHMWEISEPEMVDSSLCWLFMLSSMLCGCASSCRLVILTLFLKYVVLLVSVV